MARKSLPKFKKSKPITSINKSNSIITPTTPTIKQSTSKKSTSYNYADDIEISTKRRKTGSIKTGLSEDEKLERKRERERIRLERLAQKKRQREIARQNRMATTKERRRVKSFIKRAAERGYKFQEDFLNSIDQMSLNELTALQPQTLYALSTNEKFGTPMSGTRAREIERSLSAKKAAETRRAKTEQNKEDTDYIPKFTDIVLSNIEEMIEQAKTHKWAQIVSNGNILDAYLQQEISNYGRDKVAIACEQAPDETKAQAIACLQSSNDEQAKAHALSMVMIIRGHIPTVEESKEFTEEFDNLDSDYMQNNI